MKTARKYKQKNTYHYEKAPYPFGGGALCYAYPLLGTRRRTSQKPQ
jgi:hypothetical protein